jgi:hypothetical protein
MQAVNRTAPIAPLRPALPEKAIHHCQYNGTTMLFAALEVAARQILGQCYHRHAKPEFDPLKKAHYGSCQLVMGLDESAAGEFGLRRSGAVTTHAARARLVLMPTGDTARSGACAYQATPVRELLQGSRHRPLFAGEEFRVDRLDSGNCTAGEGGAFGSEA